MFPADILETGVVVCGGNEIQRRTQGVACGVWQLVEVLEGAVSKAE